MGCLRLQHTTDVDQMNLSESVRDNNAPCITEWHEKRTDCVCVCVGGGLQ